MRASDVLEHGFSELEQRRLTDLAHKSSVGSLTPDERREYETYLRVGELVSALRSQARLRQRGQTKKMPPRGDPRRPLYLAVRSMRLLGLVFLLFGGGLFSAIAHLSVWLAPLALLPGLLQLTLATGLYHRQRWALGAAIAFTWAQVVAAGVAVPVLSFIFHHHILFFVGSILWLAAVIQLLYHLRRSFHAIREHAFEGPAGFEVTPR
jgi:hypothetical protein